MKTRSIASGFVIGIASLLGVVAQGCSAETGQGAEQEIGKTESALGASNTLAVAAGMAMDDATHGVDTDGNTAGVQVMNYGIKHAASCAIHDGTANKDYFVVAGGISSTGTVLDDIYVLDLTASPNQWTLLEVANASKHLTHARLDLAAMQVPGDTSKCVFVGGSSSLLGAALADVDELHVDNGAWTITARTSLNTARARFGLSACEGGSKFVAVGGVDNGSIVSSIEVSRSYAPASAWNEYTSTSPLRELDTGRYDFGFAKDPGNDRYIVAGGHASLADQDDTVEVITTSTLTIDGETNRTCVPAVTHITSTNLLSSAIEGNVAFPEGTANEFVVTAGVKVVTGTPTLQQDVDIVTVTWGSPSTISVSTTSSALPFGAYRPNLVNTTLGSPIAYQLIGGGSSLSGSPLAPSASVGKVQEYQSGFGTNGWRSANLGDARYASASAFVSATGKVYAATGQKTFGGSPVYPLSLEVITP